MSVFENLVPSDGVPSVVTIGKFDGVHIGHRAVLARLNEISEGRRVVAVTFDRHPLELFDPPRSPKPLMSLPQKVEALRDAGADVVVVLPFTAEMSEVPAHVFVDSILVRGLTTQLVIVGTDFRYGSGGAGSVDTLIAEGNAAGFTVSTVDDVCSGSEQLKVSSTAIREALALGDVESAHRLLGRAHRMRGLVVHGHQRGRDLGYPTVNLEENSEGFIPAAGVYAGYVLVNGGKYVAGISVGTNPTFDDVTRYQVEAHALDASFDAYGHVAEIEFTHRIRDLTAFTTVEDLIVAIDGDIDVIREMVARGELLM